MPPIFPGGVVSTRLLGVIGVRQSEAGRSLRNGRLVACAETDVNPARYRMLAQLGETRLRAIEFFFEAYNRAQGRSLKILGRGTAEAARKILKAAMRRHRGQAEG